MAEFEVSVPIIVVGGGACGCVAALAAHGAGAEVLLIEQDDRPAGSTGMSQGLVCAADTRSQAAHGVIDTADLFFDDIMAKTRGLTDPVIARAIAEGSGPCLEWLIDEHDFPWHLDTGFRAAYGNSAMRVHGWPGHGGTDMIQLLHQRLAACGIDTLLSAKLIDIVPDDSGKVVGIVTERPDGVQDRIGCDALILASGGFAANRAAVAIHMPEAANARYHGHEGNRGDGLWLGAAIGGALADMGSYQGYAMLTDPQGITVPPGFLVEGGIIINARGQRFVNEVDDIAGMVLPVLAQPDGTAWVVFDAGIEARCSYIPEAMALLEIGAARTADSVEGLAASIGVDRAALQATLDDACAAQQAGRADPLGRIWGDDVPPTGSLRAFRVIGAIYHTQGGLQIDGDARVLRADGSPLPNLFAGGGAARGVSGPAHWGYLPAMGLCAAVTLGRIAGLSAARIGSAA